MHPSDDSRRPAMEYKGYVAVVEFDESANVLHGRVVNCGAYPIATFECADVGELRREFERSIDEYLAWCQEDGVAPKQPATPGSVANHGDCSSGEAG